MIERIPLEQIEDNPFQVRLDYSGIAELAGSIAAMALIKADTSGLLQVPPARIVLLGANHSTHIVLEPAAGLARLASDDPNVVVQLAAGHRRFRAFQHLAAAGHTDYATFPVDIQVLDDQAMDDIAAAENANRQDLSVIEEALSLQRAMEVFGLSQAEVGAHFSHVDTGDEQGFRFYAVMGHIFSRPEILLRLGIHGDHWTLPIDALFQGPGPFLDVLDPEDSYGYP